MICSKTVIIFLCYIFIFVVTGTVALELQHTTVANPEMNRTGSKKLRLELPKGLNIQSLQKRPSIAPVPAMLEANDIMIHLDSDENEEDVSVSFNDDNVSWLDGSVEYGLVIIIMYFV